MRVSSSYEHSLQNVYWDIGIRGIRVDPSAIAEVSAIADAEIKRNLAIATNQWNCTVFIGAANAPEDEDEDATNINATQGEYALLKKLTEVGYNVPKITKKNESGEYDSSYSTGELAIQKMLAENTFGYPGGDPALRAILTIRELGKLKTSYLNARLLHRGDSYFFLCIYNVAGTLTGRRSSKRHTLGFGNNAQNFPKHSKTASLFRRCLIAREGHILLFVDQIQAEDWPVNALAGNLTALTDLRAGIDRHSALASTIFHHRVPAKTDSDWDAALFESERYVGKKSRHANNYGMTAPRFSEVLVQEAQMSVSIPICKQILKDVDEADPSVKAVFHKYVKDTLSSSRTLITPTPFQRERQFLSLRGTDTNSAAIKEAYAFIPQSTVGDNTGYSVLQLETTAPPERRYVIQEGHDSITQDIPDNPLEIYEALLKTQDAFKRTIRFHNGIEIEIPIEAEIGYNFSETVKIKDFSLKGVKDAMEKLRDTRSQSSSLAPIAVGV